MRKRRSGRGALRVLAAGALLALAGYAAAAVLAGAGTAAGPVLDASVGPGFSISLTQNGSPVTSLAPGSYTVNVSDMSSFHSFHLQGPGVDQTSGVPATGSSTWDVTFSGGSYTFFCDMHPASMQGGFSVGAPSTGSTSSTSTTATTPATSTSSTTPTTTAPGSTSTTPPVTSTSAPPTSTTTPTTSTSATTTTPPPSTLTTTAAAVVQSVRVSAKGRRGSRVVVVRIDLAKAGSVRVRLLRRGHTLAALRGAVGRRPATLRLPVPASVRAGRYTLEVVATGGRKSQRVVRAVSLGG